MKIKIFFFGITTLSIIWILIVWLFSLTTTEVYKCRNLKTNLLFIYREKQKLSSAYYEKTEYIKMPGAHLWNFECIDGDYSKDDKIIYYFGVPISGADYETFETIKWSRFAKDKNNVYCFWTIVEWADTKTFTDNEQNEQWEVLLGAFQSTGQDKNKKYTCEAKF